jgi:hypothetical protein
LWSGNVKGTHDYVRGGNPATVGQVDFTHPAFAQVQPGLDNGGWSGTKVFYAAVVDAGQARVAARLNDGTPFLLDKPMGEGHLLLLASGLENLTNDLPVHPVFVAFVDHIARYLSGSERLSGARLIDDFVQLRSAAEPLGVAASVEVVAPDGQRPLSLSEARTAHSFRLAHTGFYQVRFANGRDAVIGVNPDRRESNLEPMGEDIQRLWSGSNRSTAPNPETAMLGTEKYRSISLWWWVMLLALAVTLAETVLASNYLGTQREEV